MAQRSPHDGDHPRDLQQDRPSVTNRGEDPSRDVGNLDRARPGGGIGALVADELAAESTLDAQQVLVHADDGVVTLTGEVPEAWMRDRAAEVAGAVDGVREVRNLVACDDGSASFGPPGEAVRSEGAPRR